MLTWSKIRCTSTCTKNNQATTPPTPPPPDVRNPRPDVKSKHHPLRSNPGNRSQRAKAHRKTTITIKTSFKIEWIISFCRVDLGTSSGVNQYPAKLIYFNRHPLEFVSRYRDPQFQASDDCSYLFKGTPWDDINFRF